MAFLRGDIDNFNPARFDGPPFHLVFEQGAGSGSFFYFPVPPSQIQVTLTERVQAIQTLDGIFADDFGDGITELRMQGTFGFGKHRTTDGDRTGLENFQRMLTMIRDRLIAIKGSDPSKYAIRFVDTQHRINLRCVMPQFQALMDNQRPLITSYSMTLTVIETIKLFAEADPPAQQNRSSPAAAVGSHVEDLRAQAALLVPPTSPPPVLAIDAAVGQTYAQLAAVAYGLPAPSAPYTNRMLSLSAQPTGAQQTRVAQLPQANYSPRNSDPTLPLDGTLKDWRK